MEVLLSSVMINSRIEFTSFRKHAQNPILSPEGDSWQSRAVFNPAAWTDGTFVYLLYRAEGAPGFSDRPFASRIGLAISKDGLSFCRDKTPVLEPTEPYEIPGGCEDPRLVRIAERFYLTYTAFDGAVARVALAVSDDLRSWRKEGLLFPDERWSEFFPREEYRRLFRTGWSKAGAILDQPVNGRYWMYFGDTHIWAAHSSNLLQWEVVPDPVLSPRHALFDSRLVEPGPPPLMSSGAIWLGYNSADSGLRYSFGQALLCPENPTKVLYRSSSPLLEPTTEGELCGQVPNVVFGHGLVFFRHKWLLYYGMADSRIGVAVGELN